jgi:DNA-binding SARP family transcriptional activator
MTWACESGFLTVSIPVSAKRGKTPTPKRDVDELSLELEGGFALMRRGELWELPLSGQRVLAFLALHDRPLLRVYVAGALWPGSSETRASASLRTVIWRLHTPEARTLAISGSHLGLADGLVVDARETRDAARRVLAGDSSSEETALARLVEARDLLTDWYDDWILIEREQLREQRIRALEKLCHDLTASARFADAARAGLAAVASEPLRESSQRALIQLHLAEGNESEALRRYAAYREALERKLGLSPSPRMEELLAEVTGRSSTRGPALRLPRNARASPRRAH